MRAFGREMMTLSVLLTSSLGAAGESFAQPACPANYVNGAAAGASVGVYPCSPGEDCSGGQFDATAGIVQAVAAGSENCSGGQGAIEIHDRFVVSNLPTGTPITFRARLDATAEYDVVNPGTCVACSQVTSNQQSWVSCVNGINDPAEITISTLVGEPFELFYSSQVSFMGQDPDFPPYSCFSLPQWVSRTSYLSFLDLPLGAVVTSCQGFVQGNITAVDTGLESNVHLAIERVAPNPTNGPFAVTVILPTDSPAMIEIFDVRGRVVGRTPVSGLGQGRHTLDVRGRSPFASGIYFVRLTQGDRIAWAKEAVLR